MSLSTTPLQLKPSEEALGKIYNELAGRFAVPKLLLDVLSLILDGQTAKNICDPHAGIGELIKDIKVLTNAQSALAFTTNEMEYFARLKPAQDIEWKIGENLRLLDELQIEIDIFASILPFAVRQNKPVTLATPSGEKLELIDDLGRLILVAATKKLTPNGRCFFVVTPSFFLSQKSVLHSFNPLGIGLLAAFVLPAGTFAPYTNIPTYLIITQNQSTSQMFVGECSNDERSNSQLISNFKKGREGQRLELGKFVDPYSFKGLEEIKRAERFRQAENSFGTPAQKLSDIAIAINMGRYGDDFSFPNLENAIYIPLIGSRDVVDSLEDLVLKNQNYAQVAIDNKHSDARFVSRFLNSDLGKEIRESHKRGAVIFKITKKSLQEMEVFVPSLDVQKEILSIEAKIMEEHNLLLGLQNEVMEYRRELWNNPGSSRKIKSKIELLSGRLSRGLKQQAEESLEVWIETLPFPLASILRTWLATGSNHYGDKVNHLLHFFEALGEFSSTIFLSAFSNNPAFFQPHKEKLVETIKGQNLSFQRATFGTWKIIVEYLGKQTRLLLGDNMNGKALCAELFVDPSLRLPEMFSNTKLAEILSKTNKFRNDWHGHIGYVAPEEYRIRNQELVSILQEFREITGDIWDQVQLVNSQSCKPRTGVFENEISILKGSNGEFLSDTWAMAEYLEIDSLYLVSKNSGRALKLLPLIKLEQPPQTAKAACYFFNRKESDGLRYLVYHLSEKSEKIEPIGDVPETMRLFIEGQ